MDALERVEIAFRAWLAYHHAHTRDPFAYALDPSVLPGLRADERARFLAAVADEMQRSKETFADHFQHKYGKDHPYMPIWMASEIMTFGHVVTLFRGSSPALKQAVARRIGMHDNVVFSWLLALNTMRNACAHHARLWNRELGIKPMIPKKDPAWQKPVQVGNNRIFGILTILKYCLDRIAPQSEWENRLRALLVEYAVVPKRSMGFPDNWEECPLWAPKQF
jgi:abortive infection bacteriophage resistance protein